MLESEYKGMEEARHRLKMEEEGRHRLKMQNTPVTTSHICRMIRAVKIIAFVCSAFLVQVMVARALGPSLLGGFMFGMFMVYAAVIIGKLKGYC